MDTVDWRVEFDAEVEFRNGGSLRTEGFRLDSPGSDISDTALGELFIQHLGLLMVGTVTVSNKRLLQEPHKGSRGVATAGSAPRQLVELSHVLHDGMVTYHLGKMLSMKGMNTRLYGRLSMTDQVFSIHLRSLRTSSYRPSFCNLDLVRAAS